MAEIEAVRQHRHFQQRQRWFAGGEGYIRSNTGPFASRNGWPIYMQTEVARVSLLFEAAHCREEPPNRATAFPDPLTIRTAELSPSSRERSGSRLNHSDGRRSGGLSGTGRRLYHGLVEKKLGFRNPLTIFALPKCYPQKLGTRLAKKPQNCTSFFLFDLWFQRLNMDSGLIDVPLPMDKISSRIVQQSPLPESGSPKRNQMFAVLLSAGSFNPPTYMHLRMFELAKDALEAQGFVVVGGYMSPANDSYKKKELLPAKHRIQLCELACKTSSFVMVDPWEAKQNSYQRTLTVLLRLQSLLCNSSLVGRESLKVMLLCGSDLLESFATPGVWVLDQVRTICRDFGVVCIRRDGKDIENIISTNEILQQNKSNIFSVDEIVPNQISSTKVRECIRKGLSIKYLTPDEVIEYIINQKLYTSDY